MQCPQCNTENPEQAKFCFNCGAKLAALCPACGATLPPQAKFCFECGTPLGAPPPQAPAAPPAAPLARKADPAAERLQRLAPRGYAERLLAMRGQVEGERRIVTILSAGLKGAAVVATRLDPEDVAEIMDGALDALIEPIYQHEGTLAQMTGKGILAFFGAPIAHEDDPARACRAALEIVEAAKAYAAQLEEKRGITGLGVRVGINTGLVVAGEMGSDLRIGYTAAGDAANLAAQVQEDAPLDGVLVSHNTYRLVRGLFEVQTRDPIWGKGRAEPVQVYLVTGAKPCPFRLETRGVAGVETHMVGREQELKTLQEALRLAIEDRERQMVTVVGEAGVGKSRLLYEFEAWLELLPERARCCKARATQEMQSQPYTLLRDLFAFRFQIQESDPAGVVREKMERGLAEVLGAGPESEMKAHLLGQWLGFDFRHSPHLQDVLEDARQLHDRALLYLSEFFRAATVLVPTAILLEDVHWADDSSLDAVNHLALGLPQQPLLIVCLARPDLFERRPHWGEGQGYHQRLVLRPLSLRDSRRLAGEILKRVENLPPHLRELVIRGAEGNPFYIEELIKMFIQEGVIARPGDGQGPWRVDLGRLAGTHVPASLAAILQARLDSLPLGERGALQRAAVVGRTFWDGALEFLGAAVDGAAGEQGDAGPYLAQYNLAALRTLLREAFTDRTLRRFCQDRPPLRQVLSSFGRNYSLEDMIDVLIDYCRTQMLFSELLSEVKGANPRQYERHADEVYEYEGKAGDVPRATEEALAELHKRELVLQRETSAFVGAQEYVFAHDMLRRVTYGNILKRVRRVYHGLVAQWLIKQGGERAVEHAGLIAEHLDRAGQAGQALAYMRQAAERAVAQYANAEAVGYYTRALDLLAQVDSPPEQVREQRYTLLLGREGVYRLLGQRQAQAADLEQLETLADETAEAGHRAEAALRYATYHTATGDYAAALAAAQKAVRRAGQATDPRLEAEGLIAWGTALWRQGTFDEARQRFAESLVLAQQHDAQAQVATSLHNLGNIAYFQGDCESAHDYLEQALALRRRLGDRRREANSLSNLVAVYHGLGNLARAKACSEQALAIQQAVGNRPGESKTLINLAQILHALGEIAAARKGYERALTLCQSIGDRSSEAAVLKNLGLALHDMGDHPAARERCEQALSIDRQTGNRKGEGYSLAYLALALEGLGELAAAADAYQGALRLRREIGQEALAIDDTAGLARLALKRGDLAEALAYVEEALAWIEAHGTEGIDYPLRVHLSAADVLAAAGRAEQAAAVLAAAEALVQEQAARIGDEADRRSFLEKVPLHHHLWQRIAQRQGAR